MKSPPTRASADASSPSTQTTMPGSPEILEKPPSRATFAEVLVFFLKQKITFRPSSSHFSGRKLRCNGTKPSCYNCTVRNFECEYVPIQRRRGPGKAPKGSRSKKAATQPQASQPPTSRTVPAPSAPPNPVPEYELESLAPELRPYTSVLSLDNVGYGFHPSGISPNYPPPPDPRLIREYYYSRSRDTSSEDRSDAEDMFRKLS